MLILIFQDVGEEIRSQVGIFYKLGLLLFVCLIGASCGSPEAEYPEPTENDGSPLDSEMSLQISGSDGGEFSVEYGGSIGGDNQTGEDVIQDAPVEYTFSPVDGETYARVEKIGDWEGSIYAVLYANGRVVDCDNDDSSVGGVQLSWNTAEGSAGMVTRMICGSYRFYD